MRRSPRSLLFAPLVVLLAACGGAAGTTGGNQSGGAQVKTAAVSIGGRSQTVLTDASGHTLYYFELDARGNVSCQGDCAAEWKPITVSGGAQPKAGQGVGGMLGSKSSSQDGTVVTYNGWPLYAYTGDPRPGTANGEGVDDFGGRWFAVRPDLRPVGGAAPSAPAPTSTSGYGY